MYKKYELESLIKKIWKRVTGEQQGIRAMDNFFSSGATPLDAIKAVTLLENDLGCDLPADLIIKHPSFSGICNAVHSIIRQSEDETADLREIKLPEPAEWNFNGDVAVIGMAMRFPGGKNRNEFWENLKNGCIPDDRAFIRRAELVKGFDWNGWIYCIEDIEKFDNAFFNIPDKEAKFIDPQQRVLLETVYHALEDAGIAYKTGAGADIGVYAGTSYLNYTELIRPFFYKSEVYSPEIALSLCLNMISARVSHVFNFKGPAFSIDAACSSSLVALNYAVNDLRADKIEYAVVAGLNLIITPIFSSQLRRIGIAGDDDRCRVFDENTKGTVLGEGAGVVILRKLAGAVKNNRRVYGVIKGAGIANDGLSMGIMTPHPHGQYVSLLHAYRDAKINPAAVTYIEAHGTGTKMGDPIELHALKKFFTEFTAKKNHCGIGSVKSNIGHLLSASGMAGLIKALLCLYNRELVPSLNIATPNKNLNLEQSPFYICLKHEKWNSGSLPRIAGVNSFGIGGTNVHVVLQEAPAYRPEKVPAKRWYVLALSAKSAESLERNVRNLSHFLQNSRPVPVEHLCYSCNCLKPHYTFRKAFVVRNRKELVAGLDEYAQPGSSRAAHKMAFLFSDISRQQTVVGNRLYSASPFVRQTVDDCIAAVNAAQRAGSRGRQRVNAYRSFEDLGKEAFLYRFVIYYALTLYLQQIGISPQLIIGIGSGNILAAVITGILNLPDALRLMNSASRKHSPCSEIDTAVITGKPGIKYVSNLDWNEGVTAAGLLAPFSLCGTAEGTLRAMQEQLEKNKINTVVPLYENSLKSGFAWPATESICLQEAAAGPGEEKRLAMTIGALYEKGTPVRWTEIYGKNNWLIDGLPHYGFNRKTHWIVSAEAE